MKWETPIRPLAVLACVAHAGFFPSAAAQEADGLAAARGHFLKGDYGACLELAKAASPAAGDYPALAAMEIRVLLETGKYELALTRARILWRRVPYDAEVALEAVKALKANSDDVQAAIVTEQALQFQPETPAAGESRETVAFAELLLANRLDGKIVLERLLDPARKADPEGRAAYLAIGRLALANHDRELAAENFREGLRRFPGDPDFALGLELSGLPLPPAAREPGVESYLDIALRTNPKHVPSLLHKAASLVGRKDFKGTRDTLAQVLAVNPDQPEAWARVAACDLLEENISGAEIALKRARKFDPENALVSETVGVVLAGQYRFAEAIVYLEKAAEEDPSSPTIRFELGSNQLRFGRLEEGWENVALAHEMDPYNVAAFNLITLRDKIEDYPVREKDGVRLRMSPQDMAVFGTRALELAARAKTTLADKYGIPVSPVMVEMLPKQEDFAIRTFGLPGGEAFLGVCFGPLITMTSPRGRLGRANWEAVLWHEMAHTVTLEGTRHRIPRWLSEGISVYEERAEKPGWGQGMTSEYRARFLADEPPVPIVRLDESFAGPDIMFGYYHASLVTEFIVGRFGIGAMRSILTDLSAGKPVETALASRTMPLDELEPAFLEYARKIAADYGPGLDWKPLEDDEYIAYREDPAAWVAANPTRYSAVMMRVAQLTEEGNWAESKSLLEKIIAAEPNNREPFNPYQSLALACRGLGDTEGERAALTKLLELDANASEAAARLLEIDATSVEADRMLATNPFQEKAYRTLATTAQTAGRPEIARDALFSLLALEPRDAGRLHFELATLLRDTDRNQARRQVLKALEENPRFEAALEFLVSLPSEP